MTSRLDNSAEQAFEGLLDAVRDSGRVVRGERGGADADSQAEGYRYALELLRLAIDFYCDQDWTTSGRPISAKGSRSTAPRSPSRPS